MSISEVKALDLEERAQLVEALRLRMTLPGSVLDRVDLFLLGWEERRGQDAIFRSCRIVRLDDYRSPRILVEDYLAHVESNARRPA